MEKDNKLNFNELVFPQDGVPLSYIAPISHFLDENFPRYWMNREDLLNDQQDL